MVVVVVVRVKTCSLFTHMCYMLQHKENESFIFMMTWYVESKRE